MLAARPLVRMAPAAPASAATDALAPPFPLDDGEDAGRVDEGLRLKHRSIGTEHVLLGLIREGQGLGALVLAEAKVDLAELRRTVENSFRDAA